MIVVLDTRRLYLLDAAFRGGVVLVRQPDDGAVEVHRFNSFNYRPSGISPEGVLVVSGRWQGDTASIAVIPDSLLPLPEDNSQLATFTLGEGELNMMAVYPDGRLEILLADGRKVHIYRPRDGRVKPLIEVMSRRGRLAA